jgi:hypothetical protein
MEVKILDGRGRDLAVGNLIPKELSTGSLGWVSINKLQVKVGDCTVWVQLNIQATVVGSKEIPRDEEEPQPAA